VRVILVGSPRDRARLRATMNGSFAVVAEAESLAAARALQDDAEAFLVARKGDTHTSGDDPPGSVSVPLPGSEAVETLTGRETEVLELLAEGLSNKGIGARLGISDQTVKFHVASIAGKLGAHNRTEAVRLAVRRGLLSL
jgi:two-component system, NarL family, response regulator